VREVVVNTSWLADRFPEVLGDGSRWGMTLHYSYEGPTPLETGGGMLKALETLGDAPFLTVNGDVWTDFDFALLPRTMDRDAHLVFVDNPPQHPNGDYDLQSDGTVRAHGHEKLTYAGIGVFRAALFEGWREIIGEVEGVERTPAAVQAAAAAGRCDGAQCGAGRASHGALDRRGHAAAACRTGCVTRRVAFA
jgi:MurNAc alpha-1-phosphate uridylyltransferase